MEANSNKNKRLIFMEGMFSNVVTVGAQSFSLTALALYFGCNTFWLSIMSSLPIAAQLLQIFIGKFYKIFKTRKNALVMSSLLGRIPFLLIPLAIVFKLNKPSLLILSILVYSFFNSFNLSIWTSSVGELISKDERPKFFSKRFIILSFSTIAFSYIGGKVIDLPDKNMGIFLLSVLIAGASIVSIFLFAMQTIPEPKIELKSINLKIPFQNKNFKHFLIFIGVWNFSVEITRPYFPYFAAEKVGASYAYLGQMASILAICSIIFYPVMGKLGEKYGNKALISRGIVGTTYAIFYYCVMTSSNYKSLLLLDAITSGTSWAAINLCLFNLLLEVSEEPMESYVASYYVTVGVFGLVGGVAGGLLSELIKDVNFSIVGDAYNGLQILFMLGIFLRLYSVLLLTRVKAFANPIYYEGILPTSFNILGIRK